ncbi:MAG TPA: septal ring lytic transglycosylase RlpA family protein [bacterium]|nr:septal ring lytic transglycosylase RlpA family protein [bacterium]HOX84610.1 septal ring lytic transglycosylase RlpA family protein [bacterium]HPG45333.1 septal ring lytic transglycosylase RlpA family protein [bacterium]HPM98948.1 septal ring lytic transglycosylase RlpA family protein [bacterium]
MKTRLVVSHSLLGFLHLTVAFSLFCSSWKPNTGADLTMQSSVPVSAQTPASPPLAVELVDYHETGMASFVADEMHGKTTASGQVYNMRSMVAAHPILPFGTQVKVTNLINGKSVVVQIIDRGPLVRNRIIDLSFAAAKELGIVRKGSELVEIHVVRLP